MDSSLDVKKILDIIDTYKYRSITGERVELVVSPFHDDGKYDLSKRKVTIGLQGGLNRDRESFIVNDIDNFDEVTLPIILSYFSKDDSLKKWKVVKPEIEDATIKGYSETESGNLVYLETFEDDFFDKLDDRITVVEDNTTITKTKLNGQEKVWDEILLYCMRRRIAEDFYKKNVFTSEELESIYDFIKNLTSDKKINIGLDNETKNKNIEYLASLLEDRDKVIDLGLKESLINKLKADNYLDIMAQLVSAEKRLRRRVDLTDRTVIERIDFAIRELDKVNYFNLKNSDIKKFDNGKFSSSQPQAVLKLKNSYEKENDVRRLLCDEVYEYLEKKASMRGTIKSKKKAKSDTVFEAYDNALVDEYEKFDEILDLIKYARLDNEKYEIIIEPLEEDNNKRHVRMALVGGVSRNDDFEFIFTDGEKFDREFDKKYQKMKKEDPNLMTTMSLDDVPEKGLVKTVLYESRDRNEVLIKNIGDNDFSIKKKRNDMEENKTLDEQLRSIEREILSDADRLERVDKPVLNVIDTTEPLEKLHEYAIKYEMENNHGTLTIKDRKTKKVYIPKSEAEKNNIEFAYFWAAALCLHKSPDDVFVGEKFAFSEDTKKLFDILDVQFKESLKRDIPVDYEALEEQFKQTGVEDADKIYKKLFKNSNYIGYINTYYKKSLGLDIQEKILQDYDDIMRAAIEEAHRIQQEEEEKNIKIWAEEEARRIMKQIEGDEVKKNALIEALRIQKDQKVFEEAQGEARLIIEQENVKNAYKNASMKEAERLKLINDIIGESDLEAKRILLTRSIRKSAELEALGKFNLEAAQEEAERINKELEQEQLAHSADIEAYRLSEQNNLIDQALEQAMMIIHNQRNDAEHDYYNLDEYEKVLIEIHENAVKQAELLKIKNDSIDEAESQIIRSDAQAEAQDKLIKSDAKEEAERIQKRRELVQILEDALDAAKRINVQEEAKEEAHRIFKIFKRKDKKAKKKEQQSEDDTYIKFSYKTFKEILEAAREQSLLLQRNNQILDDALVEAQRIKGDGETLFKIVKREQPKEKDSRLSELDEAYETVESYASKSDPITIKIVFPKNGSDADVILANGLGASESIIYQRTIDRKTLEEVMLPEICRLYVKDNEISHNTRYEIANSNRHGLVVLGSEDKTLQVKNAPAKFIDLCEESLDKEVEKNKPVEESEEKAKK